jgi:hypothetical protein
MSANSLAEAFLSLVATYLIVIAPGQAWWRGYRSILPLPFAQVLASLAWTSTIALLLTATESFSLPTLLLINGATTLVGFLFNLLGRGRVPEEVSRERDRIGPAIVLAALLAYWPAYPTFYGAGDSTMYVVGGVHLARTGRLSIEDPLAASMGPILRADLFHSIHQYLPGGPPFSRTPGGLVKEFPGDPVAWPAFFPVPTIWSAIVAALLGAPAAPGFAPLFAALSLWPVFLVARRLAHPFLAVMATLAVAANGASYYFARFALSEPLATFFLWSGMAALAAWEDERREGDAELAALALGTAAVVRPELLLFTAGLLALRPLLVGPAVRASLPGRTFIVFAATVALTTFEIATIPGAYLAPLVEPVQALAFRLGLPVQFGTTTGWSVILGGILTLAALTRIRSLSLPARLALAFGPALGVLATSRWMGHRTLTWLWINAGWATLAVAALGALVLWSQRRRSGAFVVVLAAFIVTGAVLFWHPHVNPYLPWAARRAVPVLFPALFVFAAVGLDGLARASRIAAAVALALCVAGVWPAGRAVWGYDFFGGSIEDLEQLVDAIPDDGVIALSVNLNPYMFGTPLWLLYGRENFTVTLEELKAGRRQLSSATYAFRPDRPVYYLTRSEPEQYRIPLVQRERLTTLRFGRLLLEQTVDRAPVQRQRYMAGVAIDRLTPAFGEGRRARRAQSR